MMKRRGFGIIEIMAACAILALALSLTSKIMSRAADKRLQHWQALVAHECLASLADEIHCWTFDQSVAETAPALELPEFLIRQLVGSELHVAIDQPKGDERGGDPEMCKIRLSIEWPARAGRPPHHVQTVIWKFP